MNFMQKDMLTNPQLGAILDRYTATWDDIVSTAPSANSAFNRPRLKAERDGDSGLLDKSYDDLMPSERLQAQQILFSIYEQDLVYLPQASDPEQIAQFRANYEPFHASDGNVLQPYFEQSLIHDAVGEIDCPTGKSATEMLDFFSEIIERSNQSDIPALDGIKTALSPERALELYLIQNAGDFLTEASGMVRNLGGNFGPLQSELFKVLIDEYGYGVHQSKHSTLFENLMSSIDLSPKPHAYWNYYYSSSLAIHNYIHFICKNHGEFFRYIGALYYAEATYAVACRKISSTIKTVIGSDAETKYFDEHAHIDLHHTTMVLEKILRPILDTYGEAFNDEIIRGFLEFRHFVSAIDSEFLERLSIIDAIWAKPEEHIVPPSRAQSMLTEQNAIFANLPINQATYKVSDSPISMIAGEQKARIGFSPNYVLELPAHCGIRIPANMQFQYFTAQ